MKRFFLLLITATLLCSCDKDNKPYLGMWQLMRISYYPQFSEDGSRWFPYNDLSKENIFMFFTKKTVYISEDIIFFVPELYTNPQLHMGKGEYVYSGKYFGNDLPTSRLIIVAGDNEYSYGTYVSDGGSKMRMNTGMGGKTLYLERR